MITISTTLDVQCAVQSPYHPEFAPRARQMSGRWDAAKSRWLFPSAAESMVRDLCRDIYGTDGTETDLVRVRLTVHRDWAEGRGPVVFAGRVIASARGRDSGAKTGEGVIFTSGRATSGGSVKNWDTVIKEGSVIDVLDVPRPAVERELARIREQVATAERQIAAIREDMRPAVIPPPTVTAEIVSDAPSAADHAALKWERERLTARIAQIDAILSGGTPSVTRP